MLTEYAYHVAIGVRIQPSFALHFSLLPTLAMDRNATNKMANDGVPITDPAVHPIELSFPLPTNYQRMNSGQTLSTPLYTYESSVEFTTRLAKLLARKVGRPIYVGNSISFASAGMGGTVEEEMEGFKKVVEVVMEEVQKSGGQRTVNES